MLAELVLITNIAFTAAFDTVAKVPAWVSYDIEPHEVIRTTRKSCEFRPDSRVQTNCYPEAWKMLTSYGWDRGHLAPAADFNWDTNALKQTYLFSNVCPMAARLNRGAWLRTEDECRRLAASGTVHIVIYPKYEGFNSLIRHPSVPSSFTKIAYGWFGVREWRMLNRK